MSAYNAKPNESMQTADEVHIDKLVHGGQGLGTVLDGRKVFVWNALPGEKVKLRIIKSKKNYAEAVAEEIIVPSKDRIKPRESNFLATSPWQIMSFEAENRYKPKITRELFQQAGVELPDFALTHGFKEFNYRNKMEYSFYGDENGLHLALYERGTHRKHIVKGSALAMEKLDTAADALLKTLNTAKIRAGDLKTMIVRCSQSGKTAASLFVKPETFPRLNVPPGLSGVRVYHSNPKSPAAVPTKLLYQTGYVMLEDKVLGRKFLYDVDSFFQVNVPVFETAMQSMKNHCKSESLIDMYAGVGTIGLSLAEHHAKLIELNPATAAMAHINAKNSSANAEVIEASTEKVLEHIKSSYPVVFDPPRAGLHKKVIERLLDVLPTQILYLSCNPATQARDIALLQPAYKINHFEVFNFFPRTPHIEALASLDLHS